jgi:hypothetical protein
MIADAATGCTDSAKPAVRLDTRIWRLSTPAEFIEA